MPLSGFNASMESGNLSEGISNKEAARILVDEVGLDEDELDYVIEQHEPIDTYE